MEQLRGMRYYSTYAWMFIAALLNVWADPICCAEQPPVLPAPVQSAINSREGQGVRNLPPALLPTASPTVDTPGSAGSARTPASPLATTVRMKPAPFDPNDVRFPINLATALRLSDARPLIVAAAQARSWVAEAEIDAGQGPLDSRRSTLASTTSATMAAARTSTRAS